MQFSYFILIYSNNFGFKLSSLDFNKNKSFSTNIALPFSKIYCKSFLV